MKSVILQSSFLPCLGYFDLIYQADQFVFLDDVQWTRRDWRNRNRIIDNNKVWKWLTVPVKIEKIIKHTKIYEVKIDYSKNWIDNHLGNLITSSSSAFLQSPPLI